MRRWEDNIKMYLKEIHVNARIWFDSAQDRDYWRALVITALNLRVNKPYSYVSIIHVHSFYSLSLSLSLSYAKGGIQAKGI